MPVRVSNQEVGTMGIGFSLLVIATDAAVKRNDPAAGAY
jgi:hypothetical protein